MVPAPRRCLPPAPSSARRLVAAKQRALRDAAQRRTKRLHVEPGHVRIAKQRTGAGLLDDVAQLGVDSAD